MTYLAIDLEMTGLNVKKDRILEIGALRMEDGKPTGEFSALVNPHCVIPEAISGNGSKGNPPCASSCISP